MKIKLPKPTKADIILGLLNYWDPAGIHKVSGDWRAYRYEAETIAQRVRKNSKVESIEKAIIETVTPCMDGKELNHEAVSFIAQNILAALNR